MINRRPVWYLEYHSILRAHRSGFRKNRSTIDQIIKLESAVREAFTKREHLVVIFFYLEIAYDTTWKYGILKDLFDAGLRGRMPKFISKFLTGRKLSVRVVAHSPTYTTKRRLPQGIVISVTLFSMKINSIVKCLLNSVICSLYVDFFPALSQ